MPHTRPLTRLLALFLAPFSLTSACTFNANGLGSAGPSTSITPADEPEPDTDTEPGPPTTTDPTTSTGTTSDLDEPDTTTTTTTTTAADEATTLEPDLADCGNGVLDPGETCDLGYEHNLDSGACTQACQIAICGDGKVWLDEENCDHGPNNNDNTYNGCTQACQFGPRCNDGILQAEEECDASAPQLEGAVQCDPDTCRFNARLAFVTSAIYTGDMGGLAGADALCVAAAAAAGLDNAAGYQAWLSDGVATPATRLVKGTTTPMPYARRDGMQLAHNLNKLLATGLHVPLDRTEHGAMLPPGQYAWTNVQATGLPFSPTDHCKGWSSKSFTDSARLGQISPEAPNQLQNWYLFARWSSYSTWTCNFKQHLYCFED